MENNMKEKLIACVVQMLERSRTSGVAYQQLWRDGNNVLVLVVKLCITEERKPEACSLGCARDTHC